MKFQRCFFCNKLCSTPFHVTEITKRGIESFDMCKSCGEQFTADAYDLPPETNSLDKVKTVTDLLEFVVGKKQKAEAKPIFSPCKCGLTFEDFKQNGRFGCPHCYEHFKQVVQRIVFPYHRASEHVGKCPKRLGNPKEMLKLLKLQYAQAIELEQYERAGELHKQIQDTIRLINE